MGRILLSKAEGLSKLVYTALSFHSQTLTFIDHLLCNFVWNNQTHYIRKSVFINPYDKGGLNFLDFTTLNHTFKVNWIKSYSKNPTSIWNNFLITYSPNCSLNCMLLCNYNVDKIPVIFSAFHKQIRLSWLFIYKHKFSPHKFFIWYNKFILYKTKSEKS